VVHNTTKTVLIIFILILQTFITLKILSIGEKEEALALALHSNNIKII